MNTFLSSAQEALKEQYQAFARNCLAPVAHALESREKPLSEFWQELGRAGYLGIAVPAEYGGQGGQLLNLVMLVEALAHFEPGLGLTLAGHQAVIELLKKFGTAEQKKKYLPLLASGQLLATLAFSEADAGTDWQAVKTDYVAQGDSYVVSGQKAGVVNGQLAGLMIVLAKAQAGDEQKLFIVEPGQSKSITIGEDQAKLGLRSATANDVIFEKVAVAADSLLAADKPVSEPVLFAMDIAKVVLSAAALGLLEGAAQEATAYAREREQFGKTIGRNQAIQWKLADMSVDCAGSRLQTYRAAWAADESPKNLHQWAAMCKWLVTRQARMGSAEAVQILGSKALSVDSPLERFYRDSKVMEIAEGTSEFQKMLLVEALGI